MLFSRTDLAEYIQDHFEPVWQEVRSVPLVHLDFGAGQRLTRTLHGNIATWVCLPDGSAADVLPGLYEPATYRTRLEEMADLARNLAGTEPAARAERLRDYHRRQAAYLADGRVPPRVGEPVDVSKRRIEVKLEVALHPEAPAPAGALPPAPPGLEAADEGFWRALAADTQHNEGRRRRAVHELLAEVGPVRPEAITRRLYKEILGTDLDDPYLGLGTILDPKP